MNRGVSKSELLQEIYDYEDFIERYSLFDYDTRNVVMSVLTQMTKRITKIKSLD